MSTTQPISEGQVSRLLSVAALTVAGVLFALYPVIRPYGDLDATTTVGAFASPAWVIAHLAAATGFVLLPVGLLALDAGAATVMAIGAALVLPYYGAETFALHAIGTRVAAGGDPSVLDLVSPIRMGPVQIATFATGLVLVAVAAVRLAIVTRHRNGSRGSAGIPLAIGFVLFMPQFFAAPPWRIADGIVIGVGCLLLVVKGRPPAGEETESASGSSRRRQIGRAVSFVLEHQQPAGGPFGTSADRPHTADGRPPVR
jgi:hypothetical protein